jgi:hypothetical protein
MDEWIIHGIKAENEFVYNIYKGIKLCIENAKKSQIKELHAKEITDIFKPIRELTRYPMPMRITTKHRKIPVFSLMVFFT